MRNVLIPLAVVAALGFTVGQAAAQDATATPPAAAAPDASPGPAADAGAAAPAKKHHRSKRHHRKHAKAAPAADTSAQPAQ